MKKMNYRTITGILLIAALFFVGCSSTPETRVQKNPEAFERLSEEDKEKVLRGEIAIGFSRDAVLLALGDPDRTSTRTTAEGVFVNWAYQAQRLVRHPYYHHGFAHPRWYYSPYRRGYVRYRPFYHYPPDFIPENYTEMLVQFKEDKVVSFEMVEK
jgi:hypothetical protein